MRGKVGSELIPRLHLEGPWWFRDFVDLFARRTAFENNALVAFLEPDLKPVFKLERHPIKRQLGELMPSLLGLRAVNSAKNG